MLIGRSQAADPHWPRPLSRPAYVKATKTPDFSRNIDFFWGGGATFLGIKVRFAEVIARSLVPRPIDHLEPPDQTLRKRDQDLGLNVKGAALARPRSAPAFLSASGPPCLPFLGLRSEPEQGLPSLLTMVSADPWSPPPAGRCWFPSIQPVDRRFCPLLKR